MPSLLGGATLLSQVSSSPVSSPAAQPPQKPINSIIAEEFGVRSGKNWDQTAGLLRLRNHMVTNHNVHHHVTFRPGVYYYSNNRWLSNIGSATLIADGCTFTNILSDAFDANNRPFNVNGIFQDHKDQPFPQGVSFHSGIRIRSAAAGALVVRLSDPAEADMLAAGMRVFVYSFDQQWNGYPPNLRFFEWRRVVAVEKITGAIILEAPLRFGHDSLLPDTPIDPAFGPTVGSARILPLERRNYHYPEILEIIGATFARNPNRPSSDAGGLVVAADTLILRDCRHEGALWPSENRLALYERCHIASVEVDKLCARVEFRNCRFDSPVIGATGVNELVLNGCEIHGHIAVSPRVARLPEIGSSSAMIHGAPYAATSMSGRWNCSKPSITRLSRARIARIRRLTQFAQKGLINSK